MCPLLLPFRDHVTLLQPVERRDGTPRAELVMYLLAAISYIAMGFLVKQVFAWWWFGAIWLVLFVWLVPRVSERRRERAASVTDPTSEDAS